MRLRKPRTGSGIKELKFHLYRLPVVAQTLGDPEKIIWSSIRQLSSTDRADQIIHDIHQVKNRKTRAAIARNIGTYIQQAEEFYNAAQQLKADTSPLLYYYAFLNLAKARCEIGNPRFHKRQENYNHGISWKPNRNFVVNIRKDTVRLISRGVWHTLWESITGVPCTARNPTKVKVKDLLSYCQEVEVEYGSVFREEGNIFNITDPYLLLDEKSKHCWIRFCLNKEQLKERKANPEVLIKKLSFLPVEFNFVDTGNEDVYCLELKNPVPFGKVSWNENIRKTISKLNIFPYLEDRNVRYALADQREQPLLMPPVMVYYSIIFWLGSLVRYDPHSVDFLFESSDWTLIEGFLNQCRIWLLELFEWELYQCETSLISVR